MIYLKNNLDYKLIVEDLTIDYDEIVFDLDDIVFFKHGYKKDFLNRYLYWEVNWNHRERHNFIDRIEERTPEFDIDNINKGVIKLIQHLENNPDVFKSAQYNVYYVFSELKLLVKINKYERKIFIESIIGMVDQYGRDTYDWKTGTDPIILPENKNN